MGEALTSPPNLTNERQNMELANVWVEIDTLHNNVQLKRVSPPEAQVYRKQFGYKTPGTNKTTNPISHLEIVEKDAKRATQDEFDRLCRKFGNKLVEELFPGANPVLPQTFKEAGFDESKEKSPEAGKMHEILPLAKLPKEETQDEESVKETEARDAKIAAQDKLIAELQAAVKLLTNPEGKVAANEPKK